MAWPKNVRKKDLKIEYYRGHGPGGQHRNKTETCCRITHIPTGIQAKCEDQRSQKQNRESAFKVLAGRLVPLMVAKPKHERPSTERVRTYNAQRNKVVDHRLEGISWNLDDVLNGKALDDIVKALKNENC